MSETEICDHGYLKRGCRICELEQEVEEMHGKLKEIEKHIIQVDEINATCRQAVDAIRQILTKE